MDQITGRLNATGNITGALNPVYGSGASALSELDDVSINNVQNLQALQYQAGLQKWVNVDPNNLLPFIDNEFQMSKFLDVYQVMATSTGHDLSNKIIDVHFNYSMVQLKYISITYREMTEQGPVYDISIGATYSDDVNDMKCLLSFRDKRS